MTGTRSDNICNAIFDLIRNCHVNEQAIGNVFIKGIQKLADHIITREDFVLGAFVRFRPTKSGIAPEVLSLKDSDKLFFSKETTQDFQRGAKVVLEKLQTQNLFLSRLVHELDQSRARKVELVFHCSCNNIFTLISADIEWLSVAILGKVASSMTISDSAKLIELNKLEKDYTAAIMDGYFPDKDACYVLVYCPFLVGDKKPPGNFFGVFKNSNCSDFVSNSDLLAFLSEIQLAGALLFSQCSVEELVEIENHEKYQQVKNLLKQARTIRTTALHEMDRIYEEADAILDPFGLWAGVEALNEWITVYEQAFSDGVKPDVWEGANHDWPKWTQVAMNTFSNKFNGTYKERMEAALDINCVGKLFGGWIVDINNNWICIAKMLCNGNLPLRWLNEDDAACNFESLQILLENKVPPLAVYQAYSALSTQHTVNGTKGENSYTLNVEISLMTGESGFDNLLKSVDSKAPLITQSKGARVSLNKNATSSALGVLKAAANAADNNSNNGTLTYTFTFAKTVLER